MVLRAILAIWFLTTSVLGPALCCCTPAASWKATQTLRVAALKAGSAPAPHACPHCKEKPGRQSPSEGQKPSDLPKPCPEKCPCESHSLVPAVPDGTGQELRSLAQFNWLPAAPVFDSVCAVNLLPQGGHGANDHTGPPPLSGVERLHRLHILIC